jgi:hypothetical protein
MPFHSGSMMFASGDGVAVVVMVFVVMSCVQSVCLCITHSSDTMKWKCASGRSLTQKHKDRTVCLNSILTYLCVKVKYRKRFKIVKNETTESRF